MKIRVIGALPPQHGGIAPPGGLDPRPGRAAIEERRWRQFFKDPSIWWDNRTMKRTLRNPDFKNAVTGESLWIDSWFCPDWVQPKLKLLVEPRLGWGLRVRYKDAGAVEAEGQSTLPNSVASSSGTYEVLEMYKGMQEQGLKPSKQVVLSAIKLCTSLRNVENGEAIHRDLLESEGRVSDLFLASALVTMYARCGCLDRARRVFESSAERDAVLWNCIILGYAQNSPSDAEEALRLFQCMKDQGYTPDDGTFVAVFKACATSAESEEATLVGEKLIKLRCLERGKAIHAEATRAGYDRDLFVANTLIDMYGKCGTMDEAKLLFDGMCRRDVVSWNCMIMGYAQKGEGEVALEYFARMKDEGYRPGSITFVAAAKACASAAQTGKMDKQACLDASKQVHREAAQRGFETDMLVGNSLVDMYGKCGQLLQARDIFDRIRHRDVISWTSIIVGYVQNGEGQEAMKLYHQMREHGCRANSVTYVSALKACGLAADLEAGKQVHNEIRVAGLESELAVANALVDFYGRCGSMAEAEQVFQRTDAKDLVMWSSLIAGYSRLGDSNRVLGLFQAMQEQRVQPDAVTLLSILTACSHAGLVDQGKQYLEEMELRYGVTPSLQHYTCVVDMLSRANQLELAVQTVHNMPMEPDQVIWTSILSSCLEWKNVKVARLAFDALVKLGATSSSTYVLMANVNASFGTRDDHGTR